MVIPLASASHIVGIQLGTAMLSYFLNMSTLFHTIIKQPSKSEKLTLTVYYHITLESLSKFEWHLLKVGLGAKVLGLESPSEGLRARLNGRAVP